jgi:CubicO group peptidase (beta-lactamase class C family)
VLRAFVAPRLRLSVLCRLVQSMSPPDWNVGKPERAGLRSGPQQALIKWLDGLRDANIHSVVVIRRNTLVFEHYRTGEDECWGVPLGNVPHGPETKHDLRSVTKSVTSLLLGIALERKLVGSIDEPVFNWFPEYSDLRTQEKERISLSHLLTMSAGFEWDEFIPYNDPKNSEVRMLMSSDQYRYTLEQSVVSPPGEVWNYNSGGSALLGAIVSKAAGKALDEVAREFLLEPLGITDFSWTKKENGIPEVGGLRLRARDFAKIGQLVLAGGNWNGRQIVSRRWISESTAAHIGPADRLYFYGYQWWQGRSLFNGRDMPWIVAIGNGGQRIFIVPGLDLVAVITAGHYASPTQVWLPLLIFNRYVLGAVSEV